MAENVNVVAEDPGKINPENINPVLRALYKFGSFFGFGNKLYASNKQRKKVFFDVIVYIILVFGSIIMLYPFYWMVMASFNASTQDVLKTVWWPKSITEGGIFTNYATIIRDFETRVGSGANYWRIVFNTIIYSTVPVIVGVVVSAAAAFAFAKIDFKGKNVVFFYCLAAIMIPGPALMTVQYCFYVQLGWTENGLAMIIPGCFGAIMTAFFIRQYLYGLPTSIIEAAKIDGANYPRIFWSFILPLAMPAIMAQGILSFMGCWNNLLGPQMFIDRSAREYWHMTQALSQLETYTQSNADFNSAEVITASVLALIPVLVLFGIFQKTIIGSIMLTGSKE